MEQTLKKVTRTGAYGVAIKNGAILLTEKPAGCYKGLLDLPGGGIEWGESPEEALRREFAEETAMTFDTYKWLGNFSHSRHVFEENYSFHQIGLVTVE